MKVSKAFLIESLTIASWAVVLDFIIGILLMLVIGAYNIFHWVSSIMFLEFGMLLLVGSCFMSRQPLEDSKRFDENGEATTSWRIAIVGQKVFGTSLFVLLLSFLIFFFGYFF